MAKKNKPSEWSRVSAGVYKDQYGNTIKSSTKPTKNMAPTVKGPDLRKSLEKNITKAPAPAAPAQPVTQPTTPIQEAPAGGTPGLDFQTQEMPVDQGAPVQPPMDTGTPPPPSAMANEPAATAPTQAPAPATPSGPLTEAQKRLRRAQAGLQANPNSKKWQGLVAKYEKQIATETKKSTAPSGQKNAGAGKPPANAAKQAAENLKRLRRAQAGLKANPNSAKWQNLNKKYEELVKADQAGGTPPKKGGDSGSGGSPVNKYEKLIDQLENNPNDPALQEKVADQFRKLNPEQQAGQMAEQGGGFYVGAMADYGQYDPNKGFANYQQSYTDQLDKARDVVMNQFESRMGPEFQRQDMEFQQRMAEQGIDPNSGAYQAQFRAMKQAQNDARQAAQTQAFQLGSQYQQQGHEQGKEAWMTPAAIWQTMGRDPFIAQQETIQKAKQREADIAMNRASTGATIAGARIGAEANKDIAGMEMMQKYNQPQPNPWAAGIGAFVNTVGPAIANRGK